MPVKCETLRQKDRGEKLFHKQAVIFCKTFAKIARLLSLFFPCKQNLRGTSNVN
jgi:hypothetical protein